jgi:hypothetical protein
MPSPIGRSDESDRHFADQEAWTAHLKKLGVTALKVNPDPVEIATEGALWGSPCCLARDQ